MQVHDDECSHWRKPESNIRKEKNPGMSVTICLPGTVSQMALTSIVGPPMRVVPVSIADIVESPGVIGTAFPWTVTS